MGFIVGSFCNLLKVKLVFSQVIFNHADLFNHLSGVRESCIINEISFLLNLKEEN